MQVKFKLIASLFIFLLMSVTSLFAGLVVESELTQFKSALRGEFYEGVINLKNDGSEAVEARAYLTDYVFNCKGENFYNDPGSHERSNATWVEFSPKRVTIPPGQKASISYRIHVPVNTLDGTFWCMLMVEEVSEISTDPVKEQTIGISTKIRYGIQLITNIEQSGHPDLNFLDVKLLDGEDGPYLQIDLENKGTRWTRPIVWVELVNSKGKQLKRRESTEMRIFPGTSVRHTISLDKVPFDSYKALIIADGGGEDAMTGMQCNLNILRK